jgi:hypothetical protein
MLQLSYVQHFQQIALDSGDKRSVRNAMFIDVVSKNDLSSVGAQWLASPGAFRSSGAVDLIPD